MDLKLRVNPLPAPLWGKNLRSFLTRTKWNALRAEIIAERGSQCETCGKPVEKRINAHEEWDLDLSVKPHVATLQRVSLSCWQCHMCEHFGRLNTMVASGRVGPEAREDVIRHFCEVNGVDQGCFEEHYREAMREWTRRSSVPWLIDWGEFRYLLPKTELRRNYQPNGNPIAWLSFDHIDKERVAAFLDDLAELSRFYGIWIGQTNKQRLLPLHMREPGEGCGRYLGETVTPWEMMPAADPRVGDYGAFMGWEHDPINPKPPSFKITNKGVAVQIE